MQRRTQGWPQYCEMDKIERKVKSGWCHSPELWWDCAVHHHHRHTDLTILFKVSQSSHWSQCHASPRILNDDVTSTYPCSQVIVLERDERVDDCCHSRKTWVGILVWSESKGIQARTVLLLVFYCAVKFSCCSKHSPVWCKMMQFISLTFRLSERQTDIIDMQSHNIM